MTYILEPWLASFNVDRQKEDRRGLFQGIWQSHSSMARRGRKAAMSSAVTQAALHIMGTISQRPCATLFLGPVDGLEHPTYYDRIREPADIALISDRLRQNDYRTVAEWQRDVRLIKDNTAAFWGHKSLMAIIATQLYAVFEKELAKVTFYSRTKWLGRVESLRKRIDALTDKAIEFCGPAAVISLALTTVRADCPPATEFIAIPRPAFVPRPGAPTEDRNERDIQIWLRAIERLPDPGDPGEFAALIRKAQPEILMSRTDVELDIDLLKPDTIKKLIKFTKARYRELGWEYPA
jgi:hypothetical protein